MLSSAEIRNHPLLAEPDALAALGGGEVVVRAESPAGLNVRGGASDQVTHSVDGIPIFNPFHLGGVFSALNPDALDRLELRGAALPSEAAEALSGGVLAAARAPGERHRLQSGLSTTQLRAALDGPLPGRSGYLLSVRSAFPGLLTHSADPTYLRGGSQDWLATLRVPAFNGMVHLLGFGAGNDVDASARASSRLLPGENPPRNAFEWGSLSLGGGWNGVLGQTAVQLRGWQASGTATAWWRALDSVPERLRSEHDETGLALQLDRFGTAHRTTGGVRAEWTETVYRLRPPAAGGRRFELNGRGFQLQSFLRHLRQLGGGASVRGRRHRDAVRTGYSGQSVAGAAPDARAGSQPGRERESPASVPAVVAESGIRRRPHLPGGAPGVGGRVRRAHRQE